MKEANRYFQWLRNAAPIVGANGSGLTSAQYTPAPADAGKAAQCLVFVLEGGTGSVSVSRAIPIKPVPGTPAPQPPAEIAAPTPPAPHAGTVESCNPGSWVGATTLSYQWYLNGEAVPGATGQTYEVKAGDVPGTIQCVVSGSNAAATIARASALTPTNPAPTNPAPIAIAQAAVETTYAGTSEDGRYVFFAFGNGVAHDRLFRFDTQSESATEIAPTGIFALVSPDGSHAFFSSTEALSGGEENDNGEEAETGKRNLYTWDGSATRFIGRLSAADFQQFGGLAAMNLAAWTRALGLDEQSGRAYAPTRSTPGGGAFVFQSHAQLTSYDNTEASAAACGDPKKAGDRCGEIYRYEPAAAAGERLLCVSCDPAGNPPSADAQLEDVGNSALLKAKTAIANLTEDGQEVFFQSPDQLLPEDANEVEDVYEWKAKGAGGCSRAGGCLALISSGQGEVPSILFAMSGDGHDVFFHSKEKLVGMDVAGSPSIYDARVGGGIPEPAPPAPCQGDACQGQGALPPALPNPASTGGGEGGGEASSSPPSSCAKGKHRVKGRCVAAKHHKKRHRRAHAKPGGKR